METFSNKIYNDTIMPKLSYLTQIFYSLNLMLNIIPFKKVSLVCISLMSQSVSLKLEIKSKFLI